MTQPVEPTTPALWRDNYGGVFHIDVASPTDVARARALEKKGTWAPATDVDVQAAQARKEAGSASGIAKTAAEGLASGTYDALTAVPRAATAIGSAVAGVADPFADATGRNALEALRYAGGRAAGESHEEANRSSYAYGDRQKLRAEVNPGTATASSIGGQIVGSAGIGALGEGAASGFTGALTPSGAAPGVVARLGGAVARGAVEGGIYGVTGAQDQAYLENRKLTGEQVLATAGLSALLGGGLSFATSGAGELFGAAKDAIANRAESKAGALAQQLDRAPTAADVDKLAEKTFGEAAPGVGEKWTKLYSKAASAATGEDAESIEKLTSLSSEGRALRKLATDGDAVREEAARSMRGHIDELNGASAKLQEEYMGGLKEAHVDRAIRKGDQALAQQLEFASGQVESIRSQARKAIEELESNGTAAELPDDMRRQLVNWKRVDKALNVADRAIDASTEAGSGSQAFMSLDQLKRRVGRVVKAAPTSEMQGLYEGLRTGLEDEGMWGRAGQDQARINAAWSKYLDSQQLFERRLSTELGRDPSNPWVRKLTADPAKIDAYVNGLTSAKNDLIHQTIKDHVANTKDLASAISELTDIGSKQLAEVGKVYRGAQGFEKSLGQAEGQLLAANQLRALQEAGGKSISGMAATAGAVIGGAPGAAVGGAIGSVFDAIRNPAKVVRSLTALESMAEKAQGKFTGQLDSFFSNMSKGVEKAHPVASKVVGRTVNAAKGAAMPAALEAFQGKHETPEKAYRARMDELAKAQENYGGQIRENAARGFGGLVHQEPAAVSSAVIAATNAVSYLQSKLPDASVANASSLTPLTSRPTPSRAEIAQYATIWQAVDKPLSVLRDLNTGTITRDQVDAIHAVYPRLYDWIRTETMTRLREMDLRGVEVPIRQRLLLDTLLDLDGAGEPAFSPDFAAKYAAGMKDVPAQQQKSPAPGGRPGASKVASRYATGTSAMLGGTQS